MASKSIALSPSSPPWQETKVLDKVLQWVFGRRWSGVGLPCWVLPLLRCPGVSGGSLVGALIGRGSGGRGVVSLSTVRSDYLNSGAEWIGADIRDSSSLGVAFDGVDTVFHVAALPRIPLSIAKPVETHMTNVVGTLNVLIAARD